MEVSCGLNLAYIAVLTPADGRTCRGLESAGAEAVFGKGLHFLQG